MSMRVENKMDTSQYDVKASDEIDPEAMEFMELQGEARNGCLDSGLIGARLDYHHGFGADLPLEGSTDPRRLVRRRCVDAQELVRNTCMERELPHDQNSRNSEIEYGVAATKGVSSKS